MENAFGQPQTVLLLGGTSEIGVAIVAELASPTLRHVTLACRDTASGERTAEALRARVGAATVDVVEFDAARPDTHHGVIAGVSDSVGDVDVVIVAFGQLGDPTTVNVDPVAAAQVATVNFTGAVSASLAAVNRLRAQGHGTLMVISSVAGERVRKDNFVYGGTKAGLDGFAQGLADSLVGSGVNVLIVRPGFVHTRMTAGMKAAPFSTTTEAVAKATVAGLRRGRRVVWAPGLLRHVFAVLRHLPTPLWRKVSNR